MNHLVLTELIFRMTVIEVSESNVAMYTWLPRVGYSSIVMSPCMFHLQFFFHPLLSRYPFIFLAPILFSLVSLHPLEFFGIPPVVFLHQCDFFWRSSSS